MNTVFREPIIIVEITPMLRLKIEQAVEDLLDLLDAVDGDPEIEGNGDDEPGLGWTRTGATGRVGRISETDLEEEASL